LVEPLTASVASSRRRQ